MKDLTPEYNAKFAEWQKKQSPLSKATDKMLSTSAKLEQQHNDELYAHLNPFHRCGKLGLRFMEETFGYITSRTFFYRKEEKRYVHDDQQDRAVDPDDEGGASTS